MGTKRISQIDFPDTLVQAARSSTLTIFAGAGVSKGEPAGLEDFDGLTRGIAQRAGRLRKKDEQADHFLGRMHKLGVNVHDLAKEILDREGVNPTPLHRDLLRLFGTPDKVKIVTTNFDLLFEKAAKEVFDSAVEVYRAPALPVPMSDRLRGIVHVHGSFEEHKQIVLTDEDFGRAYLTEGWALRFLLELFRNHTVLFVGYSHNDVVMDYLSRALPVEEKIQRFALTEEPGEWEFKGIIPILFKKSANHDYSQLCDGVNGIANLCRMTTLEWKNEIEEIARLDTPPVDEGRSDRLELALEDVVNLRFFCKGAASAEWIDWLDARTQLKPLFSPEPLDERARQLGVWLAQTFAITDPESLWLLFGKYKMRINANFWHWVARSVANDTSLAPELHKKWVVLLLHTRPNQHDDHNLLRLADRCAAHSDERSLIAILDALIQHRIGAQRSYPWPGRENPPRVDFETELTTNNYVLGKVWSKHLRPQIAQIAESVLSLIVNRFTEMHESLSMLGRAGRHWNPHVASRSTLKLPSGVSAPSSAEILIDAARECLEWLALNNPNIAAQFCSRLANSDDPIQRRLSVHVLSVRSDMSADEKLLWLLNTVGLHDVSLRQESRVVVEEAISSATSDTQEAVIDNVLARTKLDAADAGADEIKELEEFNWLRLLKELLPGNTRVNSSLSALEARHPEWTVFDEKLLIPREYDSLWNVATLIGKSPATVLQEAAGFELPDKWDHKEWDVAKVVTATAKENISWSLDVAREALKAGFFHRFLWQGLVDAWVTSENMHAQIATILHIIDNQKLIAHRVDAISRFLHQTVGYMDDSPPVNLLGHANQIARRAWLFVNRTAPNEEPENWYADAINEPAGVLAEFIVASTVAWWNQQDPKPTQLVANYRGMLTDILNDDSIAGGLGRSVLAGKFPLIFQMDPDYAHSMILPIFDPGNRRAVARQAWDGFIHWTHYSPELCREMEDSFFKLLPIEENDITRPRAWFIERVSFLICYYISNPLESWIPTLLRDATDEDRATFAYRIEDHLRGAEEKDRKDWWDRWIKAYWVGRLNGVPAALKGNEITSMLNWLSFLGTAFPEAVTLACQIQPTSVEHLNLVYELGESPLVNDYPGSVVSILEYIYELTKVSPSWILSGFNDIVARLKALELPVELSQRIDELQARVGNVE